MKAEMVWRKVIVASLDGMNSRCLRLVYHFICGLKGREETLKK